MMNRQVPISVDRHARIRAFTLVEFMVAIGLGGLVLSVVGALTIFSARCFAQLGNYADLNGKNRNSLDLDGWVLRQATTLVAFQTNPPIKSLTLTNAQTAQTIQLSYDSNARTVALAISGRSPRTLLTGCDAWDFALFQRASTVTTTNIIFYPATNAAGALDPAMCKLISMSWN